MSSRTKKCGVGMEAVCIILLLFRRRNWRRYQSLRNIAYFCYSKSFTSGILCQRARGKVSRRCWKVRWQLFKGFPVTDAIQDQISATVRSTCMSISNGNGERQRVMWSLSSLGSPLFRQVVCACEFATAFLFLCQNCWPTKCPLLHWFFFTFTFSRAR